MIFDTKMIAHRNLVHTIATDREHIAPADLFSVIDIGSNNVKVVIFDVHGRQRAGEFNKEIRLGRGGNVHDPRKIDMTMRSVDGWFEQLKELQIPSSHIKVVATAAVREAEENGHNAFRRAYETYAGKKGWPVALHVLSHEEEAYYGVAGVISKTAGHLRESIVVEMGGASVQCSYVSHEERFLAGGRADELFLFQPYGVQHVRDFLPDMRAAYQEGLDKIEAIFRSFTAFHALQKNNALLNKDLIMTGGSFWKVQGLFFSDFGKRAAREVTVGEQELLGLLETVRGMSYDAVEGLGRSQFDNADAFLIPLITFKVLYETIAPRSVRIGNGALRDGIVEEMLRGYAGLPSSVDW